MAGGGNPYNEAEEEAGIGGGGGNGDTGGGFNPFSSRNHTEKRTNDGLPDQTWEQWIEETFGVGPGAAQYLPEWDDWEIQYHDQVYKDRVAAGQIKYDSFQNQKESSKERFKTGTNRTYMAGDLQGTQQKQQAQMAMGKQGFQGSGFNQQQLDMSIKNLQEKLSSNLKDLSTTYRDQTNALDSNINLLLEEKKAWGRDRDKARRDVKDDWEDRFYARIAELNSWGNK